jgi:hypothetical protein
MPLTATHNSIQAESEIGGIRCRFTFSLPQISCELLTDCCKYTFKVFVLHDWLNQGLCKRQRQTSNEPLFHSETSAGWTAGYGALLAGLILYYPFSIQTPETDSHIWMRPGPRVPQSVALRSSRSS